MSDLPPSPITSYMNDVTRHCGDQSKPVTIASFDAQAAHADWHKPVSDVFFIEKPPLSVTQASQIWHVHLTFIGSYELILFSRF